MLVDVEQQKKRMMDVLEVPVTTTTGEHALITAHRQHVDRFNLRNSVVRPFQRKDGSVILFLHIDGIGQEVIGEGKTRKPGKSLPHMVTGERNTYGYVDDNMFNITFDNLISRKQLNTYRFRTQR